MYSTTPRHPAPAAPCFDDMLLSSTPDSGARRPPAIQHRSFHTEEASIGWVKRFMLLLFADSLDQQVRVYVA